MTPAEMRAEVFARDGYRCQFPNCTLLLTEVNPLQLAHLKHRGMGGAPDRNSIDNGLALCRWHHDWLDGRMGSGARLERETILRAVVGL